MVWYITTKWTEQSESLFTQESLDQMEHLVFIEILNFTKKKSPAGLIETQGRQVADMWLQVSWNRIKTWTSSEVLVQIMPEEHFRVQFAGLNK